MGDDTSIKSPYWETSKQDIVWSMDDVFDTRRYTSLQHFTDTLNATYIKNPDEVKFYLEVLEIRMNLLRQVISEHTIK